jgi:hypothetical protein
MALSPPKMSELLFHGTVLFCILTGYTLGSFFAISLTRLTSQTRSKSTATDTVRTVATTSSSALLRSK